MTWSSPPSPPSPAVVLRLIRDERANTQPELERALGVDALAMPSHRNMARRQLEAIVQSLVRAQLVASQGERFSASPMLADIQSALRLSLEELARRDAGALLIEPFFGPVRPLPSPVDVFVVMPFREDLRAVYDGPIRSAAAQVNMTVARGDDFFSGNTIMAEVWSALRYCRVVVADCTGRNANVFYEVGIAHAIGKPVVLLAQAVEDVPFDLRHVRMIVYAPTTEGMTRLETVLGHSLRNTSQPVRNSAVGHPGTDAGTPPASGVCL